MDAYGDIYSTGKTYLADDDYSNGYIKKTIESIGHEKILKNMDINKIQLYLRKIKLDKIKKIK